MLNLDTCIESIFDSETIHKLSHNLVMVQHSSMLPRKAFLIQLQPTSCHQ